MYVLRCQVYVWGGEDICVGRWGVGVGRLYAFVGRSNICMWRWGCMCG